MRATACCVGPLEVVEGRAEFLHLPTVNLDCNQLFFEHIRSSDLEAHHVVIADQAGLHLREGDDHVVLSLTGRP